MKYAVGEFSFSTDVLKGGFHLNVFFSPLNVSLIAGHRRPKAAMRSPIAIEPVHSFSYGHLRQR